jgi:hypothetical protein
MDEKIPRPIMPKTALPPELRKKLGFKPRIEENNSTYDIYKPGAGVLEPVGSGKDGSYLKMKSGVPMSYRASRYAQMNGTSMGNRALIPRAKMVSSNRIVGELALK